jgi:MscS family membrane protein
MAGFFDPAICAILEGGRMKPRDLPQILRAVGLALALSAQGAAQLSPSAAPAAAPTDALGRTTPRSTVVNFLGAARKQDFETASRYLNTRKRGNPALALAQQLFVVLDRKLPPRLNEISDQLDGSLAYPADPNQDLVGTISTGGGNVDILVERIDRGKAGGIWLFSSKTLSLIPDIYDDLTTGTVAPEAQLPEFAVNKRFLSIPLFEWMAVFIGLPGFFAVMALLNRLLGALVNWVRRRLFKLQNPLKMALLPGPLRLLILAALIKLALSKLTLPLLARQLWSGAASIFAIMGAVWFLIVLNGIAERHILERLGRRQLTGAVSMLRFLRRLGDSLVLFAGVLVALQHFGVNAGTALAGLGIGGIAVALAAQKTLENIIGGVSLIADQTVRVGDFMKVGETSGLVEAIGLRSTRIRTLDRTLVSVPNGQVASTSLECYSARDQFWFHHIVGVGYAATPAQLRSMLASMRDTLDKHSLVLAGSARVNFLKFGLSSLDIELFAYFQARDWNHYCALQEEMLLRIMDIVEASGASIALPAQRLVLPSGSANALGAPPSKAAPA